jgi:chromosome segregation ATPase
MFRSVVKKTGITFFFFILFFSCKTIGVAVAPSSEAFEYREIQGDLLQKQADLAITGSKIEAESKQLSEGLEKIETALTSFESGGSNLLPQVQALRAVAEKHERSAEMLNIQLAEEREINRELSKKFDEYDVAQNKALSEMAGNIASLEVENRRLKGQRNTLLAVVITAVSIIVIIIAVKVLRAMRIIPV